MANDPTTPQPGDRDIDGELERLLPELLRWARANLHTFGIGDPSTAEDVVHRIIVKLKGRPTYDRGRGPLGPYLRQAIRGEVHQELRERMRRPGNYGGGFDDGALKQVEDSFFQSFSELDTAWRRQRKGATRGALQRIRERVKPMDWEVFIRLKVLQKYTAAEVARQINEEFRPAEPLDLAKAHRVAYKVQKVFYEEFHRAGINPFEEGPDLTEICKEMGIPKPGDGPAIPTEGHADEPPG